MNGARAGVSGTGGVAGTGGDAGTSGDAGPDGSGWSRRQLGRRRQRRYGRRRRHGRQQPVRSPRTAPVAPISVRRALLQLRRSWRVQRGMQPDSGADSGTDASGGLSRSDGEGRRSSPFRQRVTSAIPSGLAMDRQLQRALECASIRCWWCPRRSCSEGRSSPLPSRSRSWCSALAGCCGARSGALAWAAALLALAFGAVSARSALHEFELRRVSARDALGAPVRCAGQVTIAAIADRQRRDREQHRARPTSSTARAARSPARCGCASTAARTISRAGDRLDVVAQLAPVRLFRNLDAADPTPGAARRATVLSGTVLSAALVARAPGSRPLHRSRSGALPPPDPRDLQPDGCADGARAGARRKRPRPRGRRGVQEERARPSARGERHPPGVRGAFAGARVHVPARSHRVDRGSLRCRTDRRGSRRRPGAVVRRLRRRQRFGLARRLDAVGGIECSRSGTPPVHHPLRRRFASGRWRCAIRWRRSTCRSCFRSRLRSV